MPQYTAFDLLCYLLLYAFFSWAAQVFWHSVKDRRFVNRGLLTLPLDLSYGVTFVLLLLVLPTLGQRYVLQFIITAVAVIVVRSLFDAFEHRMSRLAHWETGSHAGVPDTASHWLKVLLTAAVTMVLYYLLHPVLAAFMLLLPGLLKRIVVFVLAALVLLDFLSVLYAVRRRTPPPAGQSAQRLADRLTANIWRRLQRAYPGVAADPSMERSYTFAQGLCWDKLVWVFLICALLGDIIETFYCGLVNGEWMNRSSVLYGPFSFVWGIGAVVLTVSLQKLAGKSDRWVFLGGFVIGGAYEYMCSVFTELVFGTVFWDYSDMPLNIGGRTNVLFCFFWGLLAMIWVKTIYPPLDRAIEKVPPIAGKIATWVVVFAMVCNGLLTGAAMVRYNTRAVSPEPSNVVERFLDERYGDAYIEHRWPNMIVTQ